MRTQSSLFIRYYRPTSPATTPPDLIARAVAFLFCIHSPMAGYFSNHSQSRFLANSNNNSQTTTMTTTTQTPASVNPQSAARPRVPSSKHFSTFVAPAAGDEKTQGKDKVAGNGAPNGTASVHPLRNTYVRMLACAHTADL